MHNGTGKERRFQQYHSLNPTATRRQHVEGTDFITDTPYRNFLTENYEVDAETAKAGCRNN